MPTPNKAARIPPLNSLRFIPANTSLPAGYNTWPFDQGFFYQQIKPFIQSPTNYCQKVLSSDTISIYLDCLAKKINISILDDKGNTVAAIATNMVYNYSMAANVDSHFGDQFYTFIKQFTPASIPLANGYYYVLIEALYVDDDDPLLSTMYISECIHVRDSGWSKTMLLEYTNSQNDYDILFEGGDTPNPFAFRVEAYIDIDPGGFSLAFEDMLHQVTKLDEEPYRVAELAIGGSAGVPPYFLDKVNRALACDSFKADGVQWQKEPNAKWNVKKLDNYAMKAATITLRDNPAVSAWEYNNSDDPATFRIHDDTADDTHD